MKKLLIVLGVVAAFLTATAFVTTEKTNTLPGPGDGVTSCKVYGADGYTVSVTKKVITPDDYGSLRAGIKLNKTNTTGSSIEVVVQLRNSSNRVIESKTEEIDNNLWGTTFNFDTQGIKGEVYYVTINSASCN